MDRRGCSSYKGFDGFDPFETVIEWSGRGERAARILRRRCRSEGVERSPYEDAHVAHDTEYSRHQKTHFTLNHCHERYHHECSLPTAENGDYLMAHELRCSHSSKQKPNRLSPTRPLLVTSANGRMDDSRLPRVEELLEKVDQEMMEVSMAKQPLKSILNNPIPKSPQQGILKKPKPKTYQDPKFNVEGRRRQRASSESDNLINTSHLGAPIPGYESRLTYLSPNTKRAKDNSGTGYSYGSAIASLSLPVKSQNYTKSRRCSCKDQVLVKGQHDGTEVHILRTTAINCEPVKEEALAKPKLPAAPPPLPPPPRTVSPPPRAALPPPRIVSPPPRIVSPPPRIVSPKPRIVSPPRRAVSPPHRAVSSPTPAPSSPPRKVKSPKKKKGKPKKPVAEGGDGSPCRSPSPILEPDPPAFDASWQMETDSLLAEINKLEAMPIAPSPPPAAVKKEDSVSKVPAKLTNGAPVTVKKVTVKEEKVEKPQPKKTSKETDLFLTALHTTNPFSYIPTRKDSPLTIPESVTSCLRPSLFPRVPPYLRFVSHDEAAPLRIPVGIAKHLKWKLTTITPIVVKKTLTNSGFRLVKSECDTSECPQEETVEWIGIWGKHMKSLMFRAIKDGQKMNHFPGTFQIGRKDRLWRNLQKLTCKFGDEEFGIMPKTYVLPHDMKLLKHDWEWHMSNNERWIIKPPASARGTGIKVVSRWTQIPKKRPVVVQRYVKKPYLINGSKFDMRLYVLVTSVHPLRIYMYRDGLARFASVKYNDEVASLNDRYMHLTNYSINRLSKNYTPNEDFAACEGHKWTLLSLFQYLKTEKKVDTDALWESMKDLVIKTIISGEGSISSLTKANITSRYNCYELFGVDVLLDEDLKPWLLEVSGFNKRKFVQQE